MLLPSPVLLLEPVTERGVETSSAGLGDAGVRDLARERVLDRVLPLPGNRRAAATTDEVAFFEQVEIRPLPSEQVDQRAGPERAADHGRRLQRGLLGRGQPVDAGSQDRMHGVGYREPL